MTQAVSAPEPASVPAEPAASRTARGWAASRDAWLWLWSRVRPYVGWVLAGLGALALFLGWWGVSGEALTAKQIPYLVSGGLTGVALVVLASVFLATEDVRHQLATVEELRRKVDALYALFVEELDRPSTPDAGPTAAAGGPVALPSGSSYHRVDCTLVAGKSGAAPVDAPTIGARGLRPCRVCDPAPPG